jgi:monoamine oxidase
MYDIIIIGGGIAGMYSLYQLHKRSPTLKVLLIEKESYLGGRVLTYKDKFMTVEEGAGRISGSQPHIMALIKELGLNSKLLKIESTAVFSPADGTSSIESSMGDAPKQKSNFVVDPSEDVTGRVPLKIFKGINVLEPIYENLLDIGFGPKTLPNVGLILKLVIASKTYSKKTLQKQTLESFANKILTKEQVEYIKRSFGYYSELVIMNAYDAIKLLNELGPNNQFYSLEGGLSQILEKMEEKVSKNSNIKILKGKEVINIIHNPQKDDNFEIHVENRTNPFHSKKCVCALPKPALLKFRIFNPIKTVLNKVECGTLCRIYSKFDPNPQGKIWFKDLPKMTTDNELRMIIPYDTKKGIIMISYSDNKYADFWKKIYDKKGMNEVNKVLQEKIEESTGIKIPIPHDTHLFYWGCGVGYWGVGADSAEVSKKMIQPFPNMEMYVCGENYSENGQQWIEGALETSKTVVYKIQEN